MIIFRPQRDSLVESMKEAVEFDSVDDMIAYLVRRVNSCPVAIDVSPDEFSVEPISDCIDDLRFGWRNCKHVCFTRDGNVHVYGFCSDDYDIIPNGAYVVDRKNRTIINCSSYVHYETFIDIDKIPIFNLDNDDPLMDTDIIVCVINHGTDEIIIQRYPCISYASILKYSLSDIRVNALKD